MDWVLVKNRLSEAIFNEYPNHKFLLEKRKKKLFLNFSHNFSYMALYMECYRRFENFQKLACQSNIICTVYFLADKDSVSGLQQINCVM